MQGDAMRRHRPMPDLRKPYELPPVGTAPAVHLCGIRRQAEEERQMRERSGPLYELAVERGRIASAAWQKASRPRKVTRMWKLIRSADGTIVRDSGDAPAYEFRWYLTSTYQ
jgi:hypothetical protein